MKVYLFISKQKTQYPMYKAYFEALRKRLDITTMLDDADIVMILGAWTMQGALLARKARKMGIPYIVCPLGDISARNCNNPLLTRHIQTAFYQRRMYRLANLVIATTPQEKAFLEKLGWNCRLSLIRYFSYSHLATENSMMDDWEGDNAYTLSDFEQKKADSFTSRTKNIIATQILQIESRMPHRNIPQKYLDDLHALLYADDYDEDEVNMELARLKLSDFAASVFQAMTEKTGLAEGFMPLPAKNGRKSKEILKYVK